MRTDTNKLPYSLIRNKYDKPQKNSRKIKWCDTNDIKKTFYNSEKNTKLEDKKLMPPPPKVIKKHIKNFTLKKEDSPYPKKYLILNRNIIKTKNINY
tara:strand:- start:80 stop:370 length:291 start_codon:yes stop_codon:yes gene_type:complete